MRSRAVSLPFACCFSIAISSWCALARNSSSCSTFSSYVSGTFWRMERASYSDGSVNGPVDAWGESTEDGNCGRRSYSVSRGRLQQTAWESRKPLQVAGLQAKTAPLKGSVELGVDERALVRGAEVVE